MELSVIVPTLNGREQLSRTLDSLSRRVPDAEVVVANGPSADGTTGMVQDREDVDVLVEIADRTVNVARNAGLEHATGDVIALVNHGLSVVDGWWEAVRDGLDAADVVTGPTARRTDDSFGTDAAESRTIARREVVYLNPDNAAFRRHVLDDVDGFDEYLDVGGARDLSHRLAGMDFDVDWRSGMGVVREFEADGGLMETDWGWKYRSLSYRLVKNYGLRPTVLRRLASHAGAEGIGTFREVLRGEVPPSEWLGTGKEVYRNVAVGLGDGLRARAIDRTPRRNPYGLSTRTDRAVSVHR